MLWRIFSKSARLCEDWPQSREIMAACFPTNAPALASRRPKGSLPLQNRSLIDIFDLQQLIHPYHGTWIKNATNGRFTCSHVIAFSHAVRSQIFVIQGNWCWFASARSSITFPFITNKAAMAAIISNCISKGLKSAPCGYGPVMIMPSSRWHRQWALYMRLSATIWMGPSLFFTRSSSASAITVWSSCLCR